MPFITVSRMYGAGGSEVAARVARALGWALFDNAVIDAVTERTGLTRAEVSARDERIPSIVERIATTLSLGTPESMPAIPNAPAMMTEERVVEITRRVIEEAVQQGPAVFVGRGAQCLLANRGLSPRLVRKVDFQSVRPAGLLPLDACLLIGDQAIRFRQQHRR